MKHDVMDGCIAKWIPDPHFPRRALLNPRWVELQKSAQPAPPKPAAPSHHLNRDSTVAVSADHFWQEDMSSAPRGVKLLLLGAGGVAVVGEFDGRDPFWIGWAALPRRRAS